MSLGDPPWAQGPCLSSDTYPARLLEGLQHLRSRGALCDVTLEAEGVPFPAHRALLAAASGFCRAHLAEGGGSPDDDAPVLKLPGVTARGLSGVLAFLYANRLELTLPTVEEVFRAAQRLLVREAMTLCLRFLEGSLNRRTCLEVLRLARRLGTEELARRAADCVARHGGRILADPARLQELDGPALCEILDGPAAEALTELELFRAAAAWLRHDPARLGAAPAVLGRIRFPLIPLRELQGPARDDVVSLATAEPASRRHLREALEYHARPYAQPALQSERTRVRAGAESLLVLGGRSADNALRDEVWAAGPSGRPWKRVGRLAGPLYNHCVAVLHGFVFVLGGQESFDPEGQRPSDKVFRFDPRHDAWLPVASMQAPRTRFHAGALSDRLVAVGGGGRLGALTDTAEEYRPAENEWRALPPFPAPVADHAGASHKGILYVAGGFAAGKTTGDTYSYLPRLRRWVRNRPMAFARCDHGMAAVGDRIVCVGGRALTNAGEWLPVRQAEGYCPAADQWTPLPLPAFDLCQFGLAARGPRVYLTGGGSLRRRTKEDGVVVCEPGRGAWEKAGALPAALADHASCFVPLPGWMAGEGPPEEEEEEEANAKKSTLNLFGTDVHPDGEASRDTQGI